MNENLVGQSLGSYRLIEMIGEGGMATVYKAYDSALDRYVAIKILPKYFAHYPEFVTRFKREAKAIAKLDHPNIVPVHSYGQEQDTMYLVMRYVPAGTLRDMLGQPLHLTVVADILRQVGSALHYAHEHGVLHRDVKPSNVLMADQKWALLTDFGLAKMIESSGELTKTGVGVGTPAYMSPEQCQGLPVDRRTDIYALGVMLYEMVTGHIPYDAETPMAIVLMHISAPLPLPRKINPDLPEGIERVILKALAKDPADRFATAEDLVKAFDKALAEIPPAEIPTRIGEFVSPAEQAPEPERPKTLVQPDTLVPEGGKTHPEPAPRKIKRPFRVWAWVLLGLLILLGVAGGVSLTLEGLQNRRSLQATATQVALVIATETVVSPTSIPTEIPQPAEPTQPPAIQEPAPPGGFVDTGQRLGDETGSGLELADLDGDGYLDALTANGDGGIIIWRNDGSGQFEPGKPFDPRENSAAVAAGDLDGDGDLDLLNCNPSDLDGLVWFNQGEGVFRFGRQAVSDGHCASLALGDLDEDGDLDAVLGGGYGDPMEGAGFPDLVWLNDGAGHFTDTGQRIGDWATRQIALGDLDQDGDLDAFVGVDDVTGKEIGNRVYFNDGRGGFSDSGRAMGSRRTNGIALADFDGDGDLDAVTSSCCGQGNRLWLNNGKGNFTESDHPVGEQDASGAAVGDLDGNGTLDVLIGNEPGAFLNVGGGNFSRFEQIFSQSFTNRVALGDLDGDGDLDAFLVKDGPAEVWLNQWNKPLEAKEPKPQEGFRDSQQRLGNENAAEVRLADLDGDGNLDAVSADSDHGMTVWWNDQTGQFTRGEPFEPISHASSEAVGDLDGDGDLDIYNCNGMEIGGKVWLNQGNRVFVDSGQKVSDAGCRTATLGDLDGDGDLDLVTGGSYGASLEAPGYPDLVWLNDGKGNFTDSGQRLGHWVTLKIALGDLDGDGDLDAFAAVDDVAQEGIGNRVYFNDGRGGLTDSEQRLGNSRGHDVALADFDNDGDLDAVVASCCAGGIRLWLNNGKGIFADSGLNFNGRDATCLAAGDLDGNGALDVLGCGVLPNQTEPVGDAWLNDGKAYFKHLPLNFGGADTRAVALGDLDGDGDLDAFIAKIGPNQVWFNQWNRKPLP